MTLASPGFSWAASVALRADTDELSKQIAELTSALAAWDGEGKEVEEEQ